MNERPEQEQMENQRFIGADTDMQICDHLCQICVYRSETDFYRCKKYPSGKPTALLDPDALCQFFSLTTLFDEDGGDP